MTIWKVTMAGEPRPKGSVKCVGKNGRHQLIWDNDAAGKTWRKLVTDAITNLANHIGQPLDGPVVVGALHVIPRGTTVTRPLPHVAGSGDVDKHARMTLDALTDGKAIRDDIRVVALHTFKVYEAPGRPTGIQLFLAPVGPGQSRRILDAIHKTAPELDGGQ